MAMPSGQIYTYDVGDSVYGLAWSAREDRPCRLALASFLEEKENFISVVEYDGSTDAIMPVPGQRIPHPYPATKVLFMPDASTACPDLLAASSDALRLWKLTTDSFQFERLLEHQNGITSGHSASAPLTSFDWAFVDTARIITCSIDKSCVIWNVETGATEAVLRPHNSPVYDVTWGAAAVFASVGADGSARIVDTREPGGRATLLFQAPAATALLRIGWCRQDPRFLAVLPAKSPSVAILDARAPLAVFRELRLHGAPVNAFAWSPDSASSICTAGDDCHALIWDLTCGGVAPAEIEPALSYKADAEVVALQWSERSSAHVAIAYADKVQLLRV